MEQIALLPYAKAAAHLYGIYHVQDFVLLIRHYENIEYNRKDLQKDLIELCKHDEDLALAGTYLIDRHRFPDFETAVIFYKQHKEKPFYYPTIEELSKYVSRQYIEIRKEHKALAQFIKQNSSASEKEIAGIMRRALMKVQGEEDIRSIMEEFLILGKLSESQLKLFTKLLEDMMNHTRRFANHGYTPYELKEIILQKQGS